MSQVKTKIDWQSGFPKIYNRSKTKGHKMLIGFSNIEGILDDLFSEMRVRFKPFVSFAPIVEASIRQITKRRSVDCCMKN